MVVCKNEVQAVLTDRQTDRHQKHMHLWLAAGKSLWVHISRSSEEKNAYLAVLGVRLSGFHIVPDSLFTHSNT